MFEPDHSSVSPSAFRSYYEVSKSPCVVLPSALSSVKTQKSKVEWVLEDVTNVTCRCPLSADRLWLSQSFNVGTSGAKIFSGPAVEEFGYSVQQSTNHEGKWYGVD